MTNEALPRIALGVVVGAISAVAITKTGLTPQSATLRWIVYCVVTGIIINTQTGMSARNLLLAGFCSALGLVGVILWMLLLGEGVIPAMSGIALDIHTMRFFVLSLLGGLLVVSTLGVSIGALARPATLDVLQMVAKINTARAKKIESFLKILVSIAGTAALLFL